MLRVLLVALLAAALEAADPRVCALRKRGLEELKVICGKASIEVAEDADAETLRAALFKKMQEELPETVRPAGTPLVVWPGVGEPGECDSPAGEAKASGAPRRDQLSGPSLDNVAASLFSKLDANGDGQLAPEEMQSLLDKVNAEARSRGEPEHDLFKSLDRDSDGKVSRSEADEFFKAMASGKAPTRPAASKGASSGGAKQDPSSAGGVADGMFKGLDVDKDGRLSKEEMKSVLEQYEANAKAQGEEISDFWSSLDTDGNGFVDKKEAQVFFEAMTAALGKSANKQEL